MSIVSRRDSRSNRRSVAQSILPCPFVLILALPSHRCLLVLYPASMDLVEVSRVHIVDTFMQLPLALP